VAEVRADAGFSGYAEGSISGVMEMIRATRDAKRARRNRSGGYWIAEADPEAGRRAVVRSWPADAVSAVLVATDGVSCGPEQYAVPASWSAVLRLVLADGPAELLRRIHDAESGDQEGRAVAGPKVHDDKAVAVAVFTPHWEPDGGAAW
jgi:hypothetical protein